MIAAIIIYFRPDWKLADPITTFVFAVIVLGTTVPVSIDCMKILMEYAPDGLDAKELYEKIQNVSALLFIVFLVGLCGRNPRFPCVGAKFRLELLHRQADY